MSHMLQIKNRGFSFFLDEKVRHDYMFRKRQLKRKINIKFLFKKNRQEKILSAEGIQSVLSK